MIDTADIVNRPHQVVEAAGERINYFLSQTIFVLMRQNEALKIDLAFHQGLIAALAEGAQARTEGKPIEANPYVPDEPDGKWPFWRQGWESAWRSPLYQTDEVLPESPLTS